MLIGNGEGKVGMGRSEHKGILEVAVKIGS